MTHETRIDYDMLPRHIRTGALLNDAEREWLARLVESYTNLFRLMRGGTVQLGGAPDFITDAEAQAEGDAYRRAGK